MIKINMKKGDMVARIDGGAIWTSCDDFPCYRAKVEEVYRGSNTCAIEGAGDVVVICSTLKVVKDD